MVAKREGETVLAAAIRYLISKGTIENQEDIATIMRYDAGTLSSFKSGKKPISSNFVVRFKELFGLDLNNPASIYFELGEGNLTYTDQRRNIKLDKTPMLVPLVPLKAQAGYVKSYDQVDFVDKLEKYALPPDVSYISAVWRYWEIGGNSMEPDLSDGDIILTSQVHPEDWRQLNTMYTYVVVTPSDIWVKRVVNENEDTLLLVPANDKEYKAYFWNLKDVNEIWTFRRKISKKLPVSKRYDLDALREQAKQNPPL